MKERVLMEVYEKINIILRENNISKKNFATKLRNLEPKLNSTYEIPSEKSIYAYLTGRIGIKIELIPYIAEVLNIPEQFLFDDSNRARMNILKYICQDINSKEKDYLLQKLGVTKDTSNYKEIIPKDIFHSINDLLIYSPEPFLLRIESALKDYKALTDKLSKI